MTDIEFRHHIRRRPVRKKPGEVGFYLPRRLVTSRHEVALSVLLASDRKPFGLAYSGLQPAYFWEMPNPSGVYVTFAVPTETFSADVFRPGDVDILVIPYEGDELVLHRALAIEVKALRASFLKQGKSPNEFGFSQTRGLQAIGFPFVAVAHLIVADRSPEVAWREMGQLRVLDRDGNVETLPPMLTDCLPVDLIERSFGRLSKASPKEDFGLVAAHIMVPDAFETCETRWHPSTRKALANPMVSSQTLVRIADYFDQHPGHFIDNPRWDA